MKSATDVNMVSASPLIGFSSDAVQPKAAGLRHASPAPFVSWPEDQPAEIPEVVLGGCKVIQEDSLVSLAGHFHRTRRAGNAIFGKRVISDPQYDMLLELFIAHHERRAVSTTDLCRAGGVPATTALRHIDKLEAGGFLRRELDSSDARRSLVVATDKAIRCTRELMRQFRRCPEL